MGTFLLTFIFKEIVGYNPFGKKEEIYGLKTEEESSTEAFPSAELEENSIGNEVFYGIPLEEIGKKLAYMYRYENMMFDIGDMEFDALGKLPEGESVLVHIYLEQEENRILFLPDEMVNFEMGESKPYYLHYEKKKDEYYYFTFDNRFISEEGVPVVSPDSGMGPSIRIFRSKAVDGIVNLGKAEVDFIKDEMVLLPVEVENNEYIDSLIREISKVLRESEYYGTYQLYIESLGRVAGKHDDYTQAKITAVLIGEGLEQYIYATLSEGDNGIECRFPFLSFTRESTENFFTAGGYFSVSGYEAIIEDLITMGVSMERGKIVFEVIPEMGEEGSFTENQIAERGVYDHRQIGLEEALDYINYVGSYTEWFGMYELGYREGSVRTWDGREVAIYTTKEKILIIPMDQTEEYTFIIGGEERKYPLAEEEEYGSESFKFYYLKKNPYAEESGQLQYTLITNDWNSVAREMFYMDKLMNDLHTGEMRYLGQGRLEFSELSVLEPEGIERDEYIAAMEEEIKDILKLEEKMGEYTITIGEYEAFSRNQVCISAAVQGQEEYYLRFLAYRSVKGNFYFWPIGFGVDGSLTECEAEAYQMNRIGIERTVELKRYTSKIIVE